MSSDQGRPGTTGRGGGVMRRGRNAEAPRFRAWSWRVVAATSLVMWGVLGAMQTTAASASTAATSGGAASKAPHPAKHTAKPAPAPTKPTSSGTGWSQTAFNARHTSPANKAGVITASSKMNFATTNPVVFTVNTFADDASGTAANCASGSATPCTLRDAVAAADDSSTVQAAVIKLAPGLYQLVYGTLSLTNPNGTLVEPTSGDASGTVVAIPEGSDPAGPAGAVSTPVVSQTDNADSATSDYTVDFTTSVGGALPGSSTITIAAPAGTVLPASGYTVTDEISSDFSPTVASVSRSNSGSTATLTLTPATGYPEVPPAQALHVSIPGVQNPTATSPANLTVATSADTTPVSSIDYSIVAASGEVTGVSASTSSLAAQATGTTYTVNFTPATALSGDATPADTVTITAPAGTDFTSSTATDYTACSGSGCTPSAVFASAAPAAGPGSSTDNQVVLTLAAGQSLPAGQPVKVQAANVTNPPAPSAAEVLSVVTSQDTTPTWSSAYSTTASSDGSIFSIDTSSNSGLSEINSLSLVGGATSNGAGVYQGSNGPVELDNNNFFDNYASSDGGGAYVDGVAYLSNDTFSTESSYDGGGLYAHSGSDVLVNNVTFDYSYAGYGGGADFEGILSGSGVTANYDSVGYSSEYGGGLYLDTYDTQLSGVTANYDSAASGGGIYEYDYSATLTNVVADHDTASNEGGGWYEDAYTVTLNSSPGFVNDFSNDSSYDGGGIYIDDYSDILSNVTANNDTASDEGGGINIDFTAGAHFTNVSASGDTAYNGGGVYAYEVSGNLTWNGGTLGSAIAPSSTASCSSGTASSDTASYEGGGFYLEDSSYNGTIALNGLTIDGNVAEYGGGFFNDYNYESGLTITNSNMSGNAACDDGSGEGGGIWGGYAVPSLVNTTVDYNYADSDGGGVYLYPEYEYSSFDMTGGSLSNNQAPYGVGGALAIYDYDNYSTTTLSNVTVDHNSATYGGGIYNDGGVLKVVGGSLSNDTASSSSGGWGGALVDEQDEPEVTNISGATLANDSGTGDPGYNGAGAIYEAGYEQLTLTNDSFSADSGDWGGALYVDDYDEAVHITGSTFSGNTAPGTTADNGGGGAIYNDGWLTSLTNDTLTGNSVTNGSGGAIYNDYNLDMSEVTVASNTASTGAGGIDDEWTATAGYSILSGDTPVECAGDGLPLGSAGYNVVSDTTCGVQSQGDNTGVNANVEPLADNGGPTETMALPVNSPAVNIKVANSCPSSYDQRGDARPTSILGVTGCDAGAYQSPAVLPHGYWLAASDGGVFTFGDVGYYGSKGGQHLNAPVVGIAETPSGKGYWLVASDGGVFNFGDATYYGSKGGQHLNAPIVGIAAAPNGMGYWLVAADGGVFNFGPGAAFYGSEGSTVLNKPVVGMAVTASGNGYWLVASDGGVFTHGDAGYFGSEGSQHLNSPVVGMASPDQGGYWLVASDGGIFRFGDVGFFGSHGGSPLNKPVVGMAAPDLGGYWLAASDGGIFNYGDAGYFGSKGGQHLNAPVVGMSGF